MPKDFRLVLLYAIILLDVVVGAAIGPIMPEFVRGLPKPQLWLSLGTALFLGVQLFAAPVLGKLSDGFGRRPILLVSAVGTLLANCLLLPVRASLYFANRLSDGFTNGMYATVRSAITDISPPENLFKNLGLEGAIISLGFVLGPMVAGTLLTVAAVPAGEQARYVVGLAVGLAALNIGLTFLLRETHTQRNGVRGAELRAELSRAVNVLTIWSRLREKDADGRLRTIVLMQVALTMSTGYYFYFVPFASLGPQQMDARALSYFFMYFGLLSIAINYGFYTFLADRLNKPKTIFWLALASVPILGAYGLIGASRPALYVVVTLDCFTISLIQGLLEGLLAQRTTEADRGEIFGLNQAVQGLASFATILVGGALSVLGLELPFAWFGLCAGAVAWQAWRMLQTADLNWNQLLE
ncbi:MFS transporter [Hymenobacter cellulosilyticus]|uniref:MFS transporter n=1 Tax=Hymenobacter cellulosilyticus TaxID=2932248 RepID=A0A8T9QFM1_9BACT|nr:MFS transporter [Hymenobacter cellulosilyticus]UOQ74620.1 MFS transporter [Hymenobacter cellulosilyticus]